MRPKIGDLKDMTVVHIDAVLMVAALYLVGQICIVT